MMIKSPLFASPSISLPHSTMSKPVKIESVVTSDPTMIASDDEDDDDQKAMKKPGSSLLGKSKVASVRCCQADKCGADLATAKPYHKRHKVCEVHAKAQVVLVNGIRQRFCQQCSRFHEVSEFDESKRSCRRRLAGHNERRRRKSPTAADSHQGHEMSSSRKAGMVCGPVNNSGPFDYSASEKHFHMR